MIIAYNKAFSRFLLVNTMTQWWTLIIINMIDSNPGDWFSGASQDGNLVEMTGDDFGFLLISLTRQTAGTHQIQDLESEAHVSSMIDYILACLRACFRLTLVRRTVTVIQALFDWYFEGTALALKRQEETGKSLVRALLQFLPCLTIRGSSAQTNCG